MLHISLTIHTFNTAATVKEAISIITTTSSDVSAFASELMSQKVCNQESLNHISESWNTLAQGMATYTAEIDKRTLGLFSVNPARPSPSSIPSTDSRHNEEPNIGTFLKLIPKSTYKSIMGSVTVDKQGNLGCVASSNKGKSIVTLIRAVPTIKVIERILNRDLIQVANFIDENHVTFSLYNSWTPKRRMDCIKELLSMTENKANQWREEHMRS